MEKAKLINKFSIRETLREMPMGSYVELPFQLVAYATVQSAVRKCNLELGAKEYSLRLDSKAMKTTVIRSCTSSH